MSAEKVSEPLPACVVFGTNPANDLPDSLAIRRRHPKSWWIYDEGQRAQHAIGQVLHGTRTLICVGGEQFENTVGQHVSEAESMRQRIQDEAFVLGTDMAGVRFLLEEEGKETLEQVERVIGLLSKHNLMHGAIGIISSWHQIPRIQYILRNKAGIHSERIVANRPELNTRIFSHTWNCIAGFAYTALALEMERRGRWQNGGPVISYYRNKRTTQANS